MRHFEAERKQYEARIEEERRLYEAAQMKLARQGLALTWVGAGAGIAAVLLAGAQLVASFFYQPVINITTPSAAAGPTTSKP